VSGATACISLHGGRDDWTGAIGGGGRSWNDCDQIGGNSGKFVSNPS
jgi:hypothetical protein